MPYASTMRVGRVTAGAVDVIVRPRLGQGAGLYPVFAVHGAAGSAGAFQDAANPGSLKLLTALAEAGYLVLATDWGGPQTYANDSVLTAFDAAMTYVAASEPQVKQGKAFLWALSMGNDAALRFAADRASQVSGVAAHIPLCDIQAIRTTNALGVRALSDAAWGITYPTAVPYRGDMVQRAAAGEMAGLPWRAWYSTADTAIPASTVTAMASAIGSTASTVITSTTDDHGDGPISKTDVNDFVSFVNTYAR